jgi:hypothetical protein
MELSLILATLVIFSASFSDDRNTTISYLVCAVLVVALILADGLVDHGAPLVRLAVLDIFGVAALVKDGVALPHKLGRRHRLVVPPALLALGLLEAVRAVHGHSITVLKFQNARGKT